MGKDVSVTQPFLPPPEEFVPYLEEIRESRCLTNGGPFHARLEQELARYLGVTHLFPTRTEEAIPSGDERHPADPSRPGDVRGCHL
jgi:hypothetical protein